MSINKNILIILIFYLIFINFGCKISSEYFDINEQFSEEEEIEKCDNILEDERPEDFSINKCINCMQTTLCEKYQRELCSFEDPNKATEYLLDKCKDYCTIDTHSRYGDVTEFNKNIEQIGLLKNVLCKKLSKTN